MKSENQVPDSQTIRQASQELRDAANALDIVNDYMDQSIKDKEGSALIIMACEQRDKAISIIYAV